MAQCNEQTEVYSRIVGYFRPVKQWNLGKREEFESRVTYDPAKFDADISYRMVRDDERMPDQRVSGDLAN